MSVNRSFETVKLRRGTRSVLRETAQALHSLYRLPSPPTYTALVLAGARALVLLQEVLRERPWADQAKLATWLALAGGPDLPADLDRSLTDGDLSAVLPEGGQQ